MNNKTVVVTGGTKGLGLAIVDQLSGEGYTVVAIGRTLSEDLEKLIQVSSNIKFIRNLLVFLTFTETLNFMNQ